MLEHLPRWLGALLKDVRAGHAKLTIVEEGIRPSDLTITLASPAFATGGRMPDRFTADGEGVSPPLLWHGIPDGTSSLALLVEDADAPLPHPIVHGLVWDLPPDSTGLAEGLITEGAAQADQANVGRNSYFAADWLPPDPPPGHGTHDYVFQLFALSGTPALGEKPGRKEFSKAIRGHVLAAGMLVGTYSRGEEQGASIEQAGLLPAGI